MAPEDCHDPDAPSEVGSEVGSEVDAVLEGSGVAFALRPRPVTDWIRALRDWTNVTLDITESRVRGEISPYVVLPREDRDLSLLVQASVQHQLTEASVRGEEVISIRFECGRSDAARVLLGLRVFSEFAVELADEGRLGTAPARDTLVLLAEIAEELSTEASGSRTAFSRSAQPHPRPPRPR